MVSSPSSIHHVGATVADLDRALAFWEGFLGVEARWRRVLEAPYLGAVVGHPGVAIDAAVVDLPGGVLLELLDYRLADRGSPDPSTKRPGNVHLCMRSEDLEGDWRRAVACGAEPVSERPVDVTEGPNRGARAAYLRAHDGITLELFEPPPAG